VEGSTHAATGVLLGAGAGLFSLAAASHRVTPAIGIGHILLFGAVVGGVALLPDADHPDATFAHTAGGLTHGTSHLLSRLFGGHRGGTHSLFGTAAAALGAQECAVWHANHWSLGALALVLALCVAGGLRVTGFMRRKSEAFLVGAAVAALAVWFIRVDLWWLVALGMALHIAEDEFTGHGCALLWPVLHRRFGGDGHQPAAARKPAPRRAAPRKPAAPRRPAVGPKPARTIRPTSKPAAAAPPPAPVPKLVRGPVSMCPHCWVGECDRCKGEGCKCPEPAAAHPGRKAAAAAQPRPVLPTEPPF